MRLPRVRFTVRTLLLTVALVAMNCGAARQLLRMTVDAETFREYILAGLLPLANVAVISGARSMARWFRSCTRGPATDSPASPSGITFFSSHLLSLGVLLTLLMPDRVEDRLMPILETLENREVAIFRAVDEPVGVLLGWSNLVVLISGPLLVLTGIGHVLAARCAATRSRPRFLTLACLVSVGFALVALAICVQPRPFGEERTISLDFQVIDSVSGEPIHSAFLRLTDLFSKDVGSLARSAFTDAEGRGRVTSGFIVRGERNVFQSLGGFSPWGRWLEVSAADHATRHIPLVDVLGPFVLPAGTGFHKVALVRGEMPEGSFRDLAGTYYYREPGVHGGPTIKIERDGRFACYYSGRAPFQEYGYLKRDGVEIEPVPIPHPRPGCHPVRERQAPHDGMGKPSFSLHLDRILSEPILP